MDVDPTKFLENAKGFTKSPLGIIALFISLIYAFACLLLGLSLNNLHSECERLPLIWFIIIFPLLILATFIYLVINHPKKLYGPSDFKDENNFIVFTGNKEVQADLGSAIEILTGLALEDKSGRINKAIDLIDKTKEKSLTQISIPINHLWHLNHWGNSFASIKDDKMMFTGLGKAREDGSNIDINEVLEIGKQYEVSCFAKSSEGTTGRFRLWCHDQTESGNSVSTQFSTPSRNGDNIGLVFQAKFSKNIRIHLQYKPGEGEIEVGHVKIAEKIYLTQ